MFSIINRQPAIDAECSGDEPAVVKGQLRLEGVSFAYPARPDVVVLKGLTLDVPAGAVVCGNLFCLGFSCCFMRLLQLLLLVEAVVLQSLVLG
jgi:hypothetical protein